VDNSAVNAIFKYISLIESLKNMSFSYFSTTLCFFGPNICRVRCQRITHAILSTASFRPHISRTHTHLHTLRHVRTHRYTHIHKIHMWLTCQLSSLELRSTVQVKRKCIFEVYIFSLFLFRSLSLSIPLTPYFAPQSSPPAARALRIM